MVLRISRYVDMVRQLIIFNCQTVPRLMKLCTIFIVSLRRDEIELSFQIEYIYFFDTVG